jgi:hypothetical protein
MTAKAFLVSLVTKSPTSLKATFDSSSAARLTQAEKLALPASSSTTLLSSADMASHRVLAKLLDCSMGCLMSGSLTRLVASSVTFALRLSSQKLLLGGNSLEVSNERVWAVLTQVQWESCCESDLWRDQRWSES